MTDGLATSAGPSGGAGTEDGLMIRPMNERGITTT
jgi:hypothetical protein